MRPHRTLFLAIALFATNASETRAEDLNSIAGPPAAVGYGNDDNAKIRFSSYSERDFPGSTQPGAPRLLNVPAMEGQDYISKLAAIDADEGFVYVPGETVLIHIKLKNNQRMTVDIHGMHSHRTETESVVGERTLLWQLDPPGGRDDQELYVVEAKQGDHVFARRGFVSLLPTGDILSVKDVIGTLGWEFTEGSYSPFDQVCGFPEAKDTNLGPLYGRFDSRLQPWNWVTEPYAPDLPKFRVRVPDPGKEIFGQPFTEWARSYQYFGADLTAWAPDSWRWGEFNKGDIEHQQDKPDGKPGIPIPPYSYTTANDSIMPNGTYFRDWLGQIYYAATKQACEMDPGHKTRIAEADMWNDRDGGPVPMHPRLLETYIDYLKAKGLPHDDLDKARNSAELAELVQNTGSQDRKDHFRLWNTYQVNLRGRQYCWEATVKGSMEKNGYRKVDWLYGNGMIGDNIDGQGQGNTDMVGQDFEHRIAPWARFEFQTDWDFMHWQSGSYRFAAQAPARANAMIGQRILDPDVYNEKVPHADPASRTDDAFKKWFIPQDAAEHNRMFTYTSFLHYYDVNGRPQRLINLDYEDTYRVSQNNSLGVLTPQTPGDEAHAILDHRQVSEGITMDQPIGFVGVVSSPRKEDIAKKTEFVVNGLAWAWYFETLVDNGVSLPAFIDANAVAKLPPATNLIFAPRYDGQGNIVISARAGGQTITRSWKPNDRAAMAEFANAIKTAAENPVRFSEGTTGFAYTFRGNRALVYVENMRSPHVADTPQDSPPPDAKEQPRTAVVDIALPFPTQGAQVWDLTGFLPVTQVQAKDGRLTFTAPLRAGDGRIFVIVPPGGAGSDSISHKLFSLANPELDQLEVPWGDTAYEKVTYRNALFLKTPQPYGARNYTQLNDPGLNTQTPARVIAPYDGSVAFAGSSPLLKAIAPQAVVVVGKNAPPAIQNAARGLAAALRMAGGPGKVFTAEDFDARPVSETGNYHILAVGTVWDNEVLQRFNDPWAMDRDWSYGRLGNQPAWGWMPRTGFTVGWVGDFSASDPSVGYLCVDRSSLMWEQRCKIFDQKNPAEKQMPLRFLFRISGSGPEGVVKAAKAFADQGMLNGCLPGLAAPVGDPRFNLTPDRCIANLPIRVPQQVDAGAGHTLTYLGWNQADGEEYDGFFSKTHVPARRIIRAKYVPEWGMTNFAASPHRASSRFELCVVDLADAESAKEATAQLAGAGATTVNLANGMAAQKAPFGTLVVTRDKSVILESAPAPWGKALLEAYLNQRS